VAEAQPVPNRFEAEILYYFIVTPRDVLYRFQVLGDSGKQGHETLGEPENIETFWEKPPESDAPPYIAGLVSQLINLSEIPKSFRFGLQYVVVDCAPVSDIECAESPQMAISYDVVFAGDRALRSATFDILPEKAKDDFIKGQLWPVFQKRFGIQAEIDIPEGWRSAGFIDHNVEIYAYEKQDPPAATIVLKAKSTSTYRRSPYGEFASAYVLPRFDVSKTDEPSPIALAGYHLTSNRTSVASRILSPIIRQNLEALELGMSAPAPKIVFIQGEPGSGKDGFAKAIHYGSRLDLTKKNASPFNSRSVAGMSLDQFRKETFGEMKDSVLVPGLITKSKGGSIFLDEFDKLAGGADPAYSELLRIWEAKEFVPLSGREVLKTGRINWVVAGAFTSTRATSDLPPDIWSRFTAQIAIQSPISSGFVEEAERSAYIRAVILSFMLGIAANATELSGFRSQMHALCRPETRLAEFAGALLFDDKKGRGGARLEPSPLLAAVADVLTGYLGAYWVAIFERKDLSREDGSPLTLEYCFPRAIEEPAEGFEYVRDITFAVDTIREWAQSYSRPPELTRVIKCYDSIRAVRQACQVIYDRLFELVVQKTSSQVEAYQIEKLLNEAFTTIDLSRRGNGMERLIGQERLRTLRFGGESAGEGPAQQAIVAREQLEKIANLATGT
jgi:hypothetical protein